MLEFVQGGELFSLRADQPECTFDAPTAAFYAACIVCALEYTPPEPIAQCTVPRVFCAQCTTRAAALCVLATGTCAPPTLPTAT